MINSLTTIFNCRKSKAIYDLSVCKEDFIVKTKAVAKAERDFSEYLDFRRSEEIRLYDELFQGLADERAINTVKGKVSNLIAEDANFLAKIAESKNQLKQSEVRLHNARKVFVKQSMKYENWLAHAKEVRLAEEYCKEVKAEDELIIHESTDQKRKAL